MPVFQVRYEASGFTDDKSILDASCSESEAQGFTETCLAEKNLPERVLGVLSGGISADDGQGDSDIRVFVSVTLQVEAQSEAEAEAMAPPEGLLTQVADMMGADFTGEVALSLESSWEVMEVEAVAPTVRSNSLQDESAMIAGKPMVYSDVVAQGLILPFKEKYTMADVHEVMVGSLFTSHPGVAGTLSEQQSAFIVKCSAVFHGTDYSSTVGMVRSGSASQPKAKAKSSGPGF